MRHQTSGNKNASEINRQIQPIHICIMLHYVCTCMTCDDREYLMGVDDTVRMSVWRTTCTSLLTLFSADSWLPGRTATFPRITLSLYVRCGKTVHKHVTYSTSCSLIRRLEPHLFTYNFSYTRPDITIFQQETWW